MNHKKKEPWRIIVVIISVSFIVFMWMEKDILSIYSTMPKEQTLPLVATTLAVTLIKVAGVTGLVLLARWVVTRIRNKK